MTDLMCKDLGLAVDAARSAAHSRSSPRPPPSRSIAWRRRTASARKDFTSVYTLLKPSSDQAPV